LVHGHTLEDQIGGQLDAGFVLTAMFEDSDPTSRLAQVTPDLPGNASGEARLGLS